MRMKIKHFAILAVLSLLTTATFICLLAFKFAEQMDTSSAEVLARGLSPYALGATISGAAFWISIIAIVVLALKPYFKNKPLKFGD